MRVMKLAGKGVAPPEGFAVHGVWGVCVADALLTPTTPGGQMGVGGKSGGTLRGGARAALGRYCGRIAACQWPAN